MKVSLIHATATLNHRKGARFRLAGTESSNYAIGLKFWCFFQLGRSTIDGQMPNSRPLSILLKEFPKF